MTTNVQALMQNNFTVVVERVNSATGMVEDTKEYQPGVHPIIAYFSTGSELRFREILNPPI